MTRKLLLLALLLLTAPLRAQDEAFFIERIEVRNHKRVSPDVVIAESRLRENESYTEAELRDAATRLSRLPFLLSVDFSLEKGAERGRYVLVLTVNETKPFFFHINGVTYFEDSPFADTEYDDRPGGVDENLALGFRWFVGRRGAVHIGFSGVGVDRAFTQDYASFAVGYTQYDLFGTRAFATLNIRRPVEGAGEGRLSPQVVVGIPVSPNQTLTLQYDETRFRDTLYDIEGGRYESQFGQRIVSARWAHNTTNDPFFPTEGTVLSIAPHYAWADGETAYIFPPADVHEKDVRHTRTYGVRAGAARFLELSERSSVWGDVRGDWARADAQSPLFWPYDEAASSAGVGAGYAFSLWTREERARGDSRFELTGRYTRQIDREYEPSFFFRDYDPNVWQASASWIRRSSWGTVRLGLGYTW